jgi:hypothetical protein
MSYQPKTGQRCTCKRGQQRDNCPECEGTGWVIDFRKIRERNTLSPKLTYRPCGAGEIASIGNNKIEIYRNATGGYIATLNDKFLPTRPVYSTPDAAKLAAERCVLEMAKVIVEILA